PLRVGVLELEARLPSRGIRDPLAPRGIGPDIEPLHGRLGDHESPFRVHRRRRERERLRPAGRSSAGDDLPASLQVDLYAADAGSARQAGVTEVAPYAEVRLVAGVETELRG